MIRFVGLAALILFGASSLAQRSAREGSLTDVSAPKPQYQVVNDNEGERIATQVQALADLQKQVDRIQDSITHIQADVEVLKKTSWIFDFIVHIVELLVPGIMIAYFSVWLVRRERKKPRTPRRPSTASA